MLRAPRQGGAVYRRYHDYTFEKFWRRELDIEDPVVIATTPTACGCNASGFASYLSGPGRTEYDGFVSRPRWHRHVVCAYLRHRSRAFLGPRALRG